MGRIFGTDGARGIVGTELTTELVVNIGRAAAQVLAAQCKHRPRFVLGRDTRISGDMMQAAVTAGLCSVGVDVIDLGVVSTPAVAYLIERCGADAGVMLSASHNPYEFNGVKLFGPTGFKLTDAEEERIEAIILEQTEPYAVKTGSALGRPVSAPGTLEDYIAHLVSAYEGGFSGRILVDCAQGSASASARRLFERMGVEADICCDTPDGININDGCGSTHIERLAPRVVEGGYDVGLAFDGDADRLLAVDERGNILDGDFLLAILSDYLTRKGQLAHNTVVVTSMTNLGFFKLMAQRGVAAEITQVGDRYVLEAMREKGFVLGGEGSGHMIFLDYATTGDGQLSAVMLLNALAAAKQPLSELGSAMKRFPQTMLNVNATPSMKAALDAHPAVQGEIARWSALLSGRGRVLVRASGTEPYIRVVVEGEQFGEIERAAREIAAAIREHLL
ncbi:MAG: phosphoglucosamine mutase [Oscillospiraceae bacterium]